MQKPKVVTICGSSKFVDIMAVCAWLIERDEQAITMSLHLLPSWYSEDLLPDHMAEHEGVADAMDELHLRKIDISDEIFFVNYEDYIGDSTRKEIEYAQTKGKKLRWYAHDPIGEKVQIIINAALIRQDTYCECPADEVEPNLPPLGNICVACGKPIRR